MNNGKINVRKSALNYIGERDLWEVGGIYVELNGSFISIVKGNSFKNIGSSSS